METTMELDDLKSAWQALDRHTQQQSALNLHLYLERKLDKVRSRLRPMQVGLWLRILSAVALIVVSAMTWPNYTAYPLIVVCGVAIQLYGILACILSARCLWMIGEIDIAQPVLRIQQALAHLRAFHLRTSFWLGNAWWVLWVAFLPLLVVWTTSTPSLTTPLIVDGIATHETLLDTLGHAWRNLAYFAVPCLLMMVLTFWLYRLWQKKWPASFARFERQSARGLADAMDTLREIQRFEQP